MTTTELRKSPSGKEVAIETIPAGDNIGDLLYWDGSSWQLIASPDETSILSMSGNGVPAWIPNGGRPIPTSETGSFSVTATSFNVYYRVASASATSISVQPIANDEWQPGGVVLVKQLSTGLITFVEGSGVTINPPFDGTLVSAGENAVLSIIASETVNVWDLGGQTAPP